MASRRLTCRSQRLGRVAIAAALINALSSPGAGQLHTPTCGGGVYTGGVCDPGGFVPRCDDAASFTRPRIPPASTAPFTMIIASDTQLPWGSDPNCMDTPEECELQYGTLTNIWFVQAMNSITDLGSWPAVVPNSGGTPVTLPHGVIINGDLTNYFRPSQHQLYRQLYDPGYAAVFGDVLQLPCFAGLGHRDYQANLNDCSIANEHEVLFGLNACAQHAARFITAMVGCGIVSNFPQGAIHSFDLGSLAYSWDHGGWHFVQLNNYPTYEAPEIGVSSSIAWLANDLAEATAAEKRIVLNMHDMGDQWEMSDPLFLAAIAGTNVAAVFSGHLHGLNGYRGTVPGPIPIPRFISGSAETKTFLLVEFANDYFTVATIDTTNGAPSFLETISLSSNLNSYPVATPPTIDSDGDGVTGGTDNCPLLANADQLDSDADGIGNACDNCPLSSNPDQQDSDSDGPGDLCDLCPLLVDPADLGDADGDGVGDLCDNCPANANADQADTDGDSLGNACDPAPYCQPLPQVVCDAAERARLTLIDNPEDAKDQLRLTLTGATARDLTAFGNPAQSARTSTCLYYDGTLVASYSVPPDAILWRAGRKGWGYSDRSAAASGIKRLREVAGATGDPKMPKITLVGRGAGLPDTTVPVPGGVTALTIQVQNTDTSVCFGAQFAAPFDVNLTKNGVGKLRTSQP